MSNQTVTVNGLDKDVYIVEGGYGTGFWNNFLRVDLEELAGGNLDKAFDVLDDVHDTAGQSFREYHGIDVCVKLPDGAKAAAIQSLCDSIAERAEELTKGFSVVWNGSNHVSRWADEGGDETPVERDDDVYEPRYYCNNDAAQYWADQFCNDVAELDCLMSYDLDDTDNVSFVAENIKADERFAVVESADDVEAILKDYYTDDSEYAYFGYTAAADSIWGKILDED